MALVPVAPDAHTKSYYKYYEQGIANLNEEQMAYVGQCKGTEEEALSIFDMDKMFEELMKMIIVLFALKKMLQFHQKQASIHVKKAVSWWPATFLCQV